jgi:hypothetical protein
MARPPKDPSERKTVDIRIPMTEEQKKTVLEAAANDQADVATWARPILLGIAQDKLNERSKRGKRPPAKP